MKLSLTRLLRPKSIAIFGGSWAESVIQQCIKFSFDGEIWPVHPYKTQIQGLKCFKTVSDLPKAPDASFIGVNRNDTPKIVNQLSKLGAGGAVCFASGFAETETDDNENQGGKLQNDLVMMAADMPILGPNCYGLINYLDGALLWPDQHGGRRVSKGVAIITQSSNIAINMTMQAKGLPISYMITAGNQAQISQSKIALDLLEDERVTAIGLHIEGIDNPVFLEQLAIKAREKKVGIIAIKVGKSKAAQEATVSHTASLAGNDSGANALFERLGISRVDTIEIFLNSLMILHEGGPLFRNTISSMSCSGGEASLIADLADPLTLDFPEFTDIQINNLSSILGPLVHIANPLDYQTYIWHDQEKLTECFTEVLKCKNELSFLIMDFPRKDKCHDTAWEPAINAIISAKKSTGSRIAVLASLDENLSEDKAIRFLSEGIIPLTGLDSGLKSAVAALKIGESWRKSLAPKLLWKNWAEIESQIENEFESKKILKNIGVKVPQVEIVKSKEELLEKYKKFKGSVTLKGVGHAHKSEHSAIALDIRKIDDLIVKLDNMQKSGAAPEGFIIEEFIQNGRIELLVGFVRDNAHGFLLTLGEGGVLSEIRNDTQNLVLPVSEEMIVNALKSLKIWPIFQGYRGYKKINLNPIIDTVMNIQNFIVNNHEKIIEIEINPFILTENDGIAVDALINKQKI